MVPCVCAHHALGGVPGAIAVYAIDGDAPVAYNPLRLIETTVFTRQVQSMLSPEWYRAPQLSLIARPDSRPVARAAQARPRELTLEPREVPRAEGPV